MKYIYSLLVGLAMIVLAGCEPGPNMSKGFSLPVGDASAGKTAFIELECNACHSIADIEQLPSNNTEQPSIKLGGSVRNVKSYGELITSIINPSHKIITTYTAHPSRLVKEITNQGVVKSEDGSSTMRIYNDVMTVTQLVNLVTFLEKYYEIDAYNRTAYSRSKSDN